DSPRCRLQICLANLQSSILLTALLGDGAVVLLDEVVVLGHELLARVGVHLGAHRLGQVAPDVLVHLGQLRRLALRLAAAAPHVPAPLRLLRLLSLGVAAGIRLLLPLTALPLARARLLPLAGPGLLLAARAALATHADLHLAALALLTAGLLLVVAVLLLVV